MESNCYYDSTDGQANSNHEQNGFAKSNEHIPENDKVDSSGLYYRNEKNNVKDFSPSDEIPEISQFESSLYRPKSRKNKYFPKEQNTSSNEFQSNDTRNFVYRSNNASRNEKNGSTQPKNNPEINWSDYINFAVQNAMQNQQAESAFMNQWPQMNALDYRTLLSYMPIQFMQNGSMYPNVYPEMNLLDYLTMIFKKTILNQQLNAIYSDRYPEVNILDYLNLYNKEKPRKRLGFTNFSKSSQTSTSDDQNSDQPEAQEEQTPEKSSEIVFSEMSVFDCPSFYGQKEDEEITPVVTSPKKEFELKSEDFPDLSDANKNVPRKKGEKKVKESSSNKTDKTENTKNHAVNNDYGLNGFLELMDEQETNKSLKLLRTGVDLENFGIDVTVSDYLCKDFVNLWVDENEDCCKNEN